MIARTHTGALLGVEALPVEVEAEIALGMPHFQLVGMGDRAIAESRHRVRSAVKHSGFTLPPKRITVNLAPSDVRKDGASFDLPIAIALLAAAEALRPEAASRYLLAGELALDGSLRPIPGALALAAAARARGLAGVILPSGCAREAAVVRGVEVLAAGEPVDVVEHLSGLCPLEPAAPAPRAPSALGDEPDLRDVRGQPDGRRALEIAAAGGHNLLLVGPPGTGKTLLARRLPSLLPDLAPEEALEATRIWSVAGRLRGRGLLTRPPFCAPHHSVSDAGLIGATQPAAPGDASLAHRGVLFLDELPEFRRNVLECLREPLEDGAVSLRRAHLAVTYPARFQLVATMNPCPCGRFSAALPGACTCDPAAVARYRGRISGPILDRIDMHVEVGPVGSAALAGPAGEPSADVRARVVAARARAAARLAGVSGIGASRVNAAIPPGLVRELCAPEPEATRVLGSLVEGWALSARAYDRLLRVARTIADLADRASIVAEDVVEATGLRVLDQQVS